MAIHNELGKRGEEIAYQYLLEKGYELISTNSQFKKSEVDIIASIDGKLIFVEVKTRKSLEYKVQELISISKQEALLRAADMYKELNKFEDEIFFDLICVIIREDKSHIIEHYKDILYEL